MKRLSEQQTQRLLESLEQKLFEPAARSDCDQLAALLADDFVEVTASGETYDKAIALVRLAEEVPPHIHAQDFSMRHLGTNSRLLLYRSCLTRRGLDHPIYSHRTSLWQLCSGNWQLSFHQGTNCPPFEIES